LIIESLKIDSQIELVYSIDSGNTDSLKIDSKHICLITGSYSLNLFKIHEPIGLPEKFSIDGYSGWAIIAEKTKDINEDLFIKLEAKVLERDFQTDFASGEDLEAIEIQTDDLKLYLGTEDGIALHNRSETNLMFPKRFSEKFPLYDKHWESVVRINDFGISIKLPELNLGEKIYFHLLSSWKYGSSSKDISAWAAVDALYIDLKSLINSLNRRIA